MIADIPFDGFYHIHTKEIEKIIRKELTPNQGQLVLNMLDNEKQDHVNLLRFRQILSQLFNEGRDIFRSGEHAVRLANLTRALNQLADEAET